MKERASSAIVTKTSRLKEIAMEGKEKFIRNQALMSTTRFHNDDEKDEKDGYLDEGKKEKTSEDEQQQEKEQHNIGMIDATLKVSNTTNKKSHNHIMDNKESSADDDEEDLSQESSECTKNQHHTSKKSLLNPKIFHTNNNNHHIVTQKKVLSAVSSMKEKASSAISTTATNAKAKTLIVLQSSVARPSLHGKTINCATTILNTSARSSRNSATQQSSSNVATSTLPLDALLSIDDDDDEEKGSINTFDLYHHQYQSSLHSCSTGGSSHLETIGMPPPPAAPSMLNSCSFVTPKMSSRKMTSTTTTTPSAKPRGHVKGSQSYEDIMRIHSLSPPPPPPPSQGTTAPQQHQHLSTALSNISSPVSCIDSDGFLISPTTSLDNVETMALSTIGSTTGNNGSDTGTTTTAFDPNSFLFLSPLSNHDMDDPDYGMPDLLSRSNSHNTTAARDAIFDSSRIGLPRPPLLSNNNTKKSKKRLQQRHGERPTAFYSPNVKSSNTQKKFLLPRVTLPSSPSKLLPPSGKKMLSLKKMKMGGGGGGGTIATAAGNSNSGGGNGHCMAAF